MKKYYLIATAVLVGLVVILGIAFNDSSSSSSEEYTEDSGSAFGSK